MFYFQFFGEIVWPLLNVVEGLSRDPKDNFPNRKENKKLWQSHFHYFREWEHWSFSLCHFAIRDSCKTDIQSKTVIVSGKDRNSTLWGLWDILPMISQAALACYFATIQYHWYARLSIPGSPFFLLCTWNKEENYPRKIRSVGTFSLPFPFGEGKGKRLWSLMQALSKSSYPMSDLIQ